MQGSQHAKDRRPPPETIPGLDELNWVEFPLALLADAAPGQTKLEFSDVITDQESKSRVHRSVGIWTHEDIGLPTWQDMDVLLALMKLTQQKNQFSDRVVEFAIYELLKMLRWPTHDGRYNHRVKLSLDRWSALFIKFTNAWRRNAKWTTTRAFHVIDNVDLTNTREGFDADLPQLFKWNDVVVESIQANHKKGLDWDFYISLKSPTSKRLYRFLDKRFAIGGSWSWELVHFSTQKLGLLPDQDTFRYKQRLSPAIAELETRRVIQPLAKKERFEKVGKGHYRVHFERARQQRRSSHSQSLKATPTGLEKELIDRGIKNAGNLVAAHPEDKIRSQIENFDDRNKHGEDKSPGWLRCAIEDENGYGFRKGYKSKSQRKEEQRQKLEAAKRKREEAERQREEEAEKELAYQAKRDRVEAFLDSLDAKGREQVEEEAVQNANPFMASLIREKGKESMFFWNVLQNHIEELLDDETDS